MFTFLDENESWHLNENIDTHCTKPRNKVLLKDEKNFQESTKMYQDVRGEWYCVANADDVKMYQKEKVDWYLLDMGNEVDMRTVYFHGQTFLCVSDSEK